jgi:phosphonoacetate hydrolase
VDGFDPSYLERGIQDGLLPNLASFVNRGFHTTAKSCMPSFTNPNNVSIITGAPPSVHGIAGNFYLDPVTKEEHMVVDDTLLRGSTILQLMSQRGVRVAAITAKDKLRQILSHGLSNAICFSAEKAAGCTLKENGIEDVEQWLGRPTPPQYSADLSLYVLYAGIKLLEEERADLFYLTLSDFVQHKHAPGDKEADDFMMALDTSIGRLAELGAIVAVTGDHGMSDKSRADGSPNVLFLQDVLEAQWGQGCARVICPITDPFVRHHGALGSFVRVHVSNKDLIDPMVELCKTLPEVEVVLPGKEAAEKFEMPLDREGDFVVVSMQGAVIGSKEEEHDLSQLQGHRLRSHGGISEQNVPLIMSTPIRQELKDSKKSWRNFDIFNLILNYPESGQS